MNDLWLRRRCFSVKEEIPLSVNVNRGYYVYYTNGQLQSDSSFFYTSTLPVQQGQVVKFTGYGGGITSVIFTMKNGVRTNRVVGVGSSMYRTYTWTATEDCNVGFSAKRGTNTPVATLDGKNIELIGY